MSGVTFRGSREGLHVLLPEGEWASVSQELLAQLERPSAQSFFRGARVLLETPNRALGIVELEELIALFERYSMELVTVTGDANAQQALDKLRGAPNEPPEDIESEPTLLDAASPVLLIRRTMRSGQVVKYPGDVVVLGDVNPGAEIIAEGDVIVWGKLRGLVHAGAKGNANAIVGALTLAPMQLRIGNIIARSPDDKRKRNAPAEVARVRDNRIVVEAWGKE
jgi:septum site-determining protein MinC